MTKKIFIAGAGGIGEAVALLLREWCDFEIELYLGDVSEETLKKARDFVVKNSDETSAVKTVLMATDATYAMKAAFTDCDVLLDCSPGVFAPAMARYARDFKMHYANLTEYVAETDEIMEIAKGAETGFVLQTGLAPGFINVLAMSLYNRFVDEYKNDEIERISMKVGALSEHAHAPHFYGFTWSPIGVATEYVKDCRVIRDHKITELPALSARETIIINSKAYEADLTSGGAADLPDHFQGKVKDLDYKTLRYVGHFGWVEEQLKGFPKDKDAADQLYDLMLENIPAVEDDLVMVHAAVDGFDHYHRRRMIEKAYRIGPLQINGHSLRAIQTTTAAPICEAAIMLLTGKYKGVVLQSQIDPDEFMNGKFVSKVYGN